MVICSRCRQPLSFLRERPYQFWEVGVDNRSDDVLRTACRSGRGRVWAPHKPDMAAHLFDLLRELQELAWT